MRQRAGALRDVEAACELVEPHLFLVDALGAPQYFRNFYIRRTLRIFPLYYAVLILALFVVPHLANVPEWTAIARENQVWYWTYMSNWGDTFGHAIAGFPQYIADRHI